MAMGIMKVKSPNNKLLLRFDLNSFMSSSRPAINMIYSNPMVEKSSMAEFLLSIYKPCGPITTPAIIKPMMPGIFSFLSRIGESKMMNNIKENINTGFSRGNSNSCIKWSKKSVINYFFSCFENLLFTLFNTLH